MEIARSSSAVNGVLGGLQPGDQYVRTADIKAAAKGRGEDVLQALGIAWDGGRRHIHCPLPGHEDHDPSWRWDEESERAYCTCGAYSIFDLVQEIQGDDFEAAKKFVAQAIGRGDLVNTVGLRLFKKSDPDSLLGAPADCQDPSLPATYLAARLGIAPRDLVQPSTRVLGLARHSYYDAGRGRDSKPVHVGDYPCAVFEIIDRDGRNHAHRVYLAEGGRDKASFGVNADGAARDPKKSARVRQGDKTSGRAVVWGTASAPHAVVAEGIETAQAVAQALQPEIEAGEVAVFAAIHAVGVEAFRPWDGAQRLTVAADRDEAKVGKGARRGELAARKLARRLTGEIEVFIALPGQPGESVDWLDTYVRDGAKAVRQGVLAAQAYVPEPVRTESDYQAGQTRGDSRSEFELTQEIYPHPVLDSMRLEYRRTSSGRIMLHRVAGFTKASGGEEAEPIWKPICSPFGAYARLRYVDRGDAYGLRINLQGMDGGLKSVDIERSRLAAASGGEIKAMLLEAGLLTEGDGDNRAVEILKAACPEREIRVVSRAGWHSDVGGLVYACPAGQVVSTTDCDVELAMGSRPIDGKPAGTLEGWLAGAKAAAQVTGCPHFTLGLAAGFAGAILSYARLDTCGFNLSGLTSRGKTTSQKLAASVWGNPAQGQGLHHSLRSTDNALEILAQRSNGSLLSLDELEHADGKIVTKMIYSLSSGVGKSRMTKGATLQNSYAWNCFVIFSGECSLETKVRRDGGVWQPGMAVRICDVDVTGVSVLSQEQMSAVEQTSGHYGHAGPLFIQRLLRSAPAERLDWHRDQVRAEILAEADRIAAGAGSAQRRAARTFAVVLYAGRLAQSYGLLPAEADIEAAVLWSWRRFCGSSEAQSLDPEEQALQHLVQWAASRMDVTIRPCRPGEGEPRGSREAVAWYDERAVYIPKRLIIEAAGGALKEQEVARVLDQRGLLVSRKSASRRVVEYIPGVGAITAYAIARQALFAPRPDDKPAQPVQQPAGRIQQAVALPTTTRFDGSAVQGHDDYATADDVPF